MVVSGLGQDKATSNSIVQWKGVGLNLGLASPGARRIGKAVDRVIKDTSFKAKAVELSRHYKKYNIRHVVDTVVQDGVKQWKRGLDKPVGDEL